jgi:hypothetical protein
MKTNGRFFFFVLAGLFFLPGSMTAGDDKEPAFPLRIEKGVEHWRILCEGKPVLEYQVRPSPAKPYVRELFTPGGVQILRDKVPDHKHHHGLMFALAADGVDFWAEEPNCGRELSRSVKEIEPEVKNGLARIGFEQTLDWSGPNSEQPVLKEIRRVETYAGNDLDATLLTWRTQLAVPPGKKNVKLTGAHYYGLGMRFVPSMDQAGDFLFADSAKGELVRGSERVTPARWCAYRSAVDGKPVTVAIFDDPHNPRHPSPIFTMRPFAYLAATLNLWKEPLAVEAGKPLKLHYGVAVWDGLQEPPVIEKTYQRWLRINKESSNHEK